GNDEWPQNHEGCEHDERNSRDLSPSPLQDHAHPQHSRLARRAAPPWWSDAGGPSLSKLRRSRAVRSAPLAAPRGRKFRKYQLIQSLTGTASNGIAFALVPVQEGKA